MHRADGANRDRELLLAGISHSPRLGRTHRRLWVMQTISLLRKLAVIAVLVVVAGVGFLGREYYRFSGQQPRLDHFKKQVDDAGGSVVTEPQGPFWLKDFYPRRITTVNLTGAKIDDTWLSCVVEAGSVPLLDLSNTPVSDAGLAILKTSDQLEKLILRETKITNAGLEHLATFPALNYVNLDGTYVTQAGASQLRERRPGLHVVGR